MIAQYLHDILYYNHLRIKFRHLAHEFSQLCLNLSRKDDLLFLPNGDPGPGFHGLYLLGDPFLPVMPAEGGISWGQGQEV